MVLRKAYASYQNQQVVDADPVKLIILLYDGAIRFIGLAKMKMQEGDAAQEGIFLMRAIHIISHLCNVLNLETGEDVATTLYQLYRYMQERLLVADKEKDPQGLDEVIALLSALKEGWEELHKMSEQETVAKT